MRDLRHQVTAVEPDNRHREALRSVQRAIDRFSDRDEALGAGISTGTSRDTLEFGDPPDPVAPFCAGSGRCARNTGSRGRAAL